MPITILTNTRFPIPKIAEETFPFKGKECEICGFIFTDMTEQGIFEEHMVRCVERKAVEYNTMKAQGYRKTDQGWVR